jgi:hypothetical protein
MDIEKMVNQGKEGITEEVEYSASNHPLTHILATLSLLQEALAARHQSEEAIKICDFIIQAYSQLLGTKNSVEISFILSQKAEALGR